MAKEVGLKEAFLEFAADIAFAIFESIKTLGKFIEINFPNVQLSG
jgi:hypothetical protein